MTLLEFAGYAGAAIIGLSLGLIGGGGSILTVPVLVYLLMVEPVLATAYSLFIVGTSALMGAFTYARKGLVSFKTAIVFAIPALVAVYLTRLFIVPSLPEQWMTLGSFTVSRDDGILLLFAILMVFASYSMIRNNGSSKMTEAEGEAVGEPVFNFPMIFTEGIVVGVLTGLVGAGGGFLIIPALVLFARLPMKLAVGTSLLIIAAKSLIGFIGDIQADQPIDWPFLMLFTMISVAGIFAGTWLSGFIDGARLKKGFGWFVLVMGLFMIIRELFL